MSNLLTKKESCCAVIVAGGSSRRMQGENKIYAELFGMPVLARTASVFDNCPLIDSLVIVVRESELQAASDICGKYAFKKPTAIVPGGVERIDSVINGLNAVPDGTEFVAVHDGARPLVTDEVITRSLRTAFLHNASVTAVPATSTLKSVENYVVKDTPDRSTMYEAQTPQTFKTELLKAALTNAKNKNLKLTDDASAAEAIGITVWISEGSYENIKITTPIDLVVAEAIIKSREAAK